MNDLDYGTRDKRGHWAPNEPLTALPPIYEMPPKPGKVLRWLPDYLFPWNVGIAIGALAYWWLVVPPVEVMQRLAWSWIWPMLVVNLVAVALFYGAFELRLYVRRAQEGRFKYNPAFPADRNSDAFWFGSQNAECILRSFLSGVPIWTGIQVLTFWAYANGSFGFVDWNAHPVWFAVLFFIVPFIQELHFYLIHRLIHVGPLYDRIHKVHHASVNPSPWSSLSMHPVEHLLYFGVVIWYVILPSHPLHALFALHRAGFGAIPGHVGFDKMELGEGRLIDTHAYAHYLHHKHFEVNYGDGLVPFDTIFGTFHDGSPEGERRMKERFAAKKARLKQRNRGTTTPAA